MLYTSGDISAWKVNSFKWRGCLQVYPQPGAGTNGLNTNELIYMAKGALSIGHEAEHSQGIDFELSSICTIKMFD